MPFIRTFERLGKFGETLRQRLTHHRATDDMVDADLISGLNANPLRGALEDLGLLAAGMEHEIKTPLAVIRVEIERMRRRLQASPELLSYLQRIEDQVHRIFEVTKTVPLLRGGREHYEQFMKRTSINELLFRSVSAVKKETHFNEIYVRHDAILFTWGAGPMLEEAFVNILKNSVEAIRKSKSKRGRIVVRASGTLSGARIDIEDNGCGMSLEDRMSVSLTGHNLRANGGLGLFITQQIVQIHNGHLEISSEVDKGSRVRITLPRLAT